MATLLSRTRYGRRSVHSLASTWRAYALLVAGLALVSAAAPMASPWAPVVARAEAPAGQASSGSDFGKLLDAVVERTAKEFWDKDRLAQVEWDKRAAEARQSIVDAPDLAEAARRINALLGELKTSHTSLLTPDDVEYYILLAVFGGADMPQSERDERFWGAGVTYAGIGHFSVRIDGRDFVDAVLEGSPAERAGLKVGDELLAVDGAPYHPIGSFRGKVGHRAGVTVRRTQDGAAETLAIPVMTIAPLHAFREATRASARVIERDGRRIGYVHVWASVGEESANALSDALHKVGAAPSGRGRNAIHSKGSPRRSDEPPPLNGLIVDMRGKIGGTGGNAGRYLELLDARGPFLRSRNKPRQADPGTLVEPTTWRGRTAVLIDHHTRSTAELFVHAYKRERQGPLIGTRTAGAVSAASAYTMPGGNLLYVAVTGLEVDGDILEGPGVAPDMEVLRPIPYSSGADPVLDAAVEHLLRKAGPRQPEQAVPSGSN
jgi:carboxyl-terminal processing protease